MARYLFNVAGDPGDEESLLAKAAEWLGAGRWPVADDEKHRDALGVGDLALIYLGSPVRAFVGRAVLASDVQSSSGEVSLTGVEAWYPPVPVSDVLALIDTSAGARADFDTGVLRITDAEYDAAVMVASSR
jgi:hypothetical protein